MNGRPAVALFGASVRAVAQSAAVAGFDVFAADLFCDEDLTEVCREAVKLAVADYPDGFPGIADRWPGVPRMYTGGLENYPEVVESLAKSGPLLGCSAEALKSCRDPMAFLKCGIKTPPVSLVADGVPSDGTWLQKPFRGSAGRGIKPWSGGSLARDCLLQHWAPGEPCSASFVGLDDRTVFVGAASQFIGESWTDAPQFAYAGGVAPLALTEGEIAMIEGTGEALRKAHGLRGLFGLDAARVGEDWTFVEINPRPTASMELFELAGNSNMFLLHRATFAGDQITSTSAVRHAGKAIIYATDRCRLVDAIPTSDDEVCFADRPSAGTRFEVGDPVATVVAKGGSADEVTQKLKYGIGRLRRRLGN